MGTARSQLAGKIDLYAATANPNEPITTGVAIGKRRRTRSTGTGRRSRQRNYQTSWQRCFLTTQSGEVEILYQRALARGM
jgi:hypothetical protein